jgi:hypothetical protein
MCAGDLITSSPALFYPWVSNAVETRNVSTVLIFQSRINWLIPRLRIRKLNVVRNQFSAVSVALVGFGLFGVLVASGCSGGVKGRPKVVPVTGAVAYNGKPIEGATVAFWVEGSPRAATGTTDAKGEYQLSTFAINDGCVPGQATITVAKEPPRAPMKSESGDGLDPGAMAKMAAERASQKSGEKPLIPLKYSQPLNTPLKETVSPTGENRFVLQLKD